MTVPDTVPEGDHDAVGASVIALPPSRDMPAARAAPALPRGSLVPSATDPGHAARFGWAVPATGTDAGWVTATDVEAWLRAVAARARFPARDDRVLGAAVLVVAVSAVPLWSVAMNEFPEGAAGTLASNSPWAPFAVMAAILLAWPATVDWRGVARPEVPGLGHLAPSSVAFPVTDAGVSALVRHGLGTRRRDVLRTSVMDVSIRDEDADHVTDRMANPGRRRGHAVASQVRRGGRRPRDWSRPSGVGMGRHAVP